MDKTDRKDPYASQARYNGLSYADFDTLGRYNSERARGIAHAPAWDAKMAELQRRWDEAELQRRVSVREKNATQESGHG